jgi:hypothetical protein
MSKTFKAGDRVWVQGKKARVVGVDTKGQVLVEFVTTDATGVWTYSPDRVCHRTF